MASDAFLYTPLFCVWFLAAFVLLENRGDFRLIPGVIKNEWFELFRGNLSFFLPITGLIYGYVPREERVLAFGAASLVYSTILSTWNNARSGAVALDVLDGGIIDSSDNGGLEECAVVPGPTRPALLSVGVRRVLVKARRAAAKERGT